MCTLVKSTTFIEDLKYYNTVVRYVTGHKNVCGRSISGTFITTSPITLTVCYMILLI